MTPLTSQLQEECREIMKEFAERVSHNDARGITMTDLEIDRAVEPIISRTLDEVEKRVPKHSDYCPKVRECDSRCPADYIERDSLGYTKSVIQHRAGGFHKCTCSVSRAQILSAIKELR